MTPERLAEIEARAVAATPGPWSSDDGNVFSAPLQAERQAVLMRRFTGESVRHPDDGRVHPLCFVATTTQDSDNFQANEDFISAARTDVPELIAEIRRLREAIVDALHYLPVRGCSACSAGTAEVDLRAALASEAK